MTLEHDLPILSMEAAMGFMGSSELFVEIAEMLLEELPELMGKIHDSAAAGDLLEVSRAAHRLKGNFGVIAAEQAQAAAKTLEFAGRDGDGAATQAAIAALGSAVERVVPEIKRQISEARG